MHYTFTNLVELLAQKTGLHTTDPAFVDLLALQAPLPEKLFRDFQSGLGKLLTMDEAKANDLLHQHFRKLTLNGIDAELRRVMTDLQLPAATIIELEAEKNSYARVRKLAEHLHASTNNTAQTAEQLQQEVTRLNSALQQQQQNQQDQLQALQLQKEEEMLDFTIRHSLQQKEYAGPAGNKKAQSLTALHLLHEELAAKQASLIRDPEGMLQLVSSQTKQPYTENNKEITYGDFVDRLLANHNMLKVTDPGATGNGGNIFKTKNPINSQRPDTNGLVSANKRQIELLEKLETQ